MGSSETGKNASDSCDNAAADVGNQVAAAEPIDVPARETSPRRARELAMLERLTARPDRPSVDGGDPPEGSGGRGGDGPGGRESRKLSVSVEFVPEDPESTINAYLIRSKLESFSRVTGSDPDLEALDGTSPLTRVCFSIITNVEADEIVRVLRAFPVQHVQVG